MAQIRRDLNKVAEGVKEESQEALKFGSERRSEVLNSLNEKGLSKSTDKIQKLAEESVRLNSVQDIQLAFETIIKKNEELLKATDDESKKAEYIKNITTQKANLANFNQAVAMVLKPDHVTETQETAIDEETFVEEMKKITEKIYQKEKDSIFRFVVEPNIHYKELEDYLNSVTSIPEDQKKLIKSQLLNDNTERLVNYFGEEPYKFYIFYCNNLNQKIKDLSSEEVGTKAFADAYNRLATLIDNMIKTASHGIVVNFDKETLALDIKFPYNIIKRVNKKIVSSKVDTLDNQLTEEEQKEKEIASFKQQIEGLISVYFEEYEKTIATLQNSLDYDLLKKQLDIFYNDKAQFPHMTADEKVIIINEIGVRYDQEKIDKYGKGFIEYLQEVIISNLSAIPFEQLKNSEYGTDEFEQNYDKVYDGLEKLRNAVYNSELSAKFIKTMSYDEEKQIFSIEFANKNVPKYEIQLFSEKTLAAIRKDNGSSIDEVDFSDLENEDPTLLTRDIDPNDFAEMFDEDDDKDKGVESPANNPSKPENTTAADITTPLGATSASTNSVVNDVNVQNNHGFIGSQAQEAAINDYLLKVEELNNTIDLINQLNQKLTANLIHDFLDIKNAKNAISLENEAKSLDQKIIAIKLELSRDRMKYKQQFNEYIMSAPQVKNAQVNTIIFNDNNLTNFVALVDEQLANAESEILKLDKERQECLDEARVAEINTQINTILAFIESQNSLIARRIVSESENKDFDIVGFLHMRREKKKEIREKIKKAYENNTHQETETLTENIEIKANEVTPLPPSKSVMPEAKPVPMEETEKKVPVEELHYEIPTVTPASLITNPVKPAKEEPENVAEPVITEVPESVIITPQPVELSTSKGKDEMERLIAQQREKQANYADDDPMKNNQITEVPEEAFDQMFETPTKDDDDLVPIAEEYIKNLFKNSEDAPTENSVVEPVIPESPYIEPQSSNTGVENSEASEDLSEDDDLVNPQVPDFEFDKNLSEKEKWQLIGDIIGEINGVSNDKEEEEKLDDSESQEDNEQIKQTPQKTTISEDSNETVRKLGYTIIDWIDNKGTIVSQEFKELYLSASNISEDAYNNALEKLAELNAINVGKYTIESKMSKEEFEKVMEEFNAEKIPKEVTVELRILELNPVITNQKVSKSNGLILEGDTITISLINKGIKAKYSEDLRKKLSDLNAKLRLIKKDNRHSRTTTDIKEDTPEQSLVFKDGREINHEDYVVDIRVPDSTDPVFEYDLAEVPEEKGHTL